MDLVILFELINHTLFYPGFNQAHLTKDACNHENSLIIDSRQAIAQAAFIVSAPLERELSKQNQAADRILHCGISRCCDSQYLHTSHTLHQCVDFHRNIHD
jgi:hypothetical protein